jgi:hypothetical protein
MGYDLDIVLSMSNTNDRMVAVVLSAQQREDVQSQLNNPGHDQVSLNLQPAFESL